MELTLDEKQEMVVKAVTDAFNDMDEELISIYVAMSKYRVRETDCATKGYRHFSLDENESL